MHLRLLKKSKFEKLDYLNIYFTNSMMQICEILQKAILDCDSYFRNTPYSIVYCSLNWATGESSRMFMCFWGVYLLLERAKNFSVNIRVICSNIIPILCSGPVINSYAITMIIFTACGDALTIWQVNKALGLFECSCNGATKVPQSVNNPCHTVADHILSMTTWTETR